MTKKQIIKWTINEENLIETLQKINEAIREPQGWNNIAQRSLQDNWELNNGACPKIIIENQLTEERTDQLNDYLAYIAKINDFCNNITPYRRKKYNEMIERTRQNKENQ